MENTPYPSSSSTASSLPRLASTSNLHSITSTSFYDDGNAAKRIARGPTTGSDDESEAQGEEDTNWTGYKRKRGLVKKAKLSHPAPAFDPTAASAPFIPTPSMTITLNRSKFNNKPTLDSTSSIAIDPNLVASQPLSLPPPQLPSEYYYGQSVGNLPPLFPEPSSRRIPKYAKMPEPIPEPLPAKRKRATRVFTEENTSDDDDYLEEPTYVAPVPVYKPIRLISSSIKLDRSRAGSVESSQLMNTSGGGGGGEESGEDGVSDGDPPDFSGAMSMGGSGGAGSLQSNAMVRSGSASGGANVLGYNERARGEERATGQEQRSYTELEDITFASPQSFKSFAYAIAASRGSRISVIDDRTHKASSAYMHISCTHRLVGCPFILKLVKAKEGGWILKSNRATDVHYTARSWYECAHPSPAEEAAIVARGGITFNEGREKVLDPRWTGHLTGSRSAGQAAAAARRAPSASSTSALATKNVSKNGFAIGGSSKSAGMVKRAMGRLPKPRTSTESQPISDDPYSHTNGNVVSADRVLAPPFERSMATMGVIQPVLTGYGPNGGGRGKGRSAAAMGQQPYSMSSILDSHIPVSSHHPASSFYSYPSASSSNGAPYYDLEPSPPRNRHISPSSPYDSSPRLLNSSRPYPMPYVPARTAPLPPAPVTSLPQWTAFLTLLDPELIPFAPLLASDSMACTPTSFFKEEMPMRIALIDALEMGLWPKLKLKKGILERGEQTWMTVKTMTDVMKDGEVLSSSEEAVSSSNEEGITTVAAREEKEKEVVEPEISNATGLFEAVEQMLGKQEEPRGDNREKVEPIILPRANDEDVMMSEGGGGGGAPRGMGTGSMTVSSSSSTYNAPFEADAGISGMGIAIHSPVLSIKPSVSRPATSHKILLQHSTKSAEQYQPASIPQEKRLLPHQQLSPVTALSPLPTPLGGLNNFRKHTSGLPSSPRPTVVAVLPSTTAPTPGRMIHLFSSSTSTAPKPS